MPPTPGMEKMTNNDSQSGLVNSDQSNLLDIRGISEEDLDVELGKGGKRKYVRFVMAALSSIPWVGSVIGAVANLSGELDQDKVNDLQKIWLKEHQQKIQNLGNSLNEIFARLDQFGDEVQVRIESPQYLDLVRSAFRSWDQADTEEKRQMLKRLITNAGASTLCADDLVRLFIKWIDQYHESHFLVIREIYRQPGISRGSIWDNLHDGRPREDSAEADLFRYLIRELSTGGVIRQQRETNYAGEFIKRTKPRGERTASGVMESAFEESKPYELTELGKQFVHYVLNDVVPRLD